MIYITSCSISPLYSIKNKDGILLDNIDYAIYVNVINGEYSSLLRHNLGKYFFGDVKSSQYIINGYLSQSDINSAVNENDVVTSVNLVYTFKGDIIRRSDNKIISSVAQSEYISYGTDIQQPFVTDKLRDNTRAVALKSLAKKINREVLLSLSGK